MRIALHDTLLETRLAESLAQALQARGHDVLVTGPVLHPQRPPDDGPERDRVDAAAQAVVAFEPDAVVAFRPFSLPHETLALLRGAGAQCMLFLGDDPVHYAVSSRDAIPHYDVMLHAGHEPVLRFYQERHGPTGVTMPFWADPADLPYTWDLVRTDVDLVFLGGAAGSVRSARTQTMDRLEVSIRVHGTVDDDHARHGAPWLDTAAQTAAGLALGRAGLNIPQIFSAYAGSDLAFPELAGLGHFWIPSRTVQYAAVGLPILTVAPASCAQTFPGAAFIADDALAGAQTHDLLSDDQALRALGQASHAAFLAHYTAAARAELIEWLAEAPGAWRELSVEERAHRYEQVQAGSARTDDTAVPNVSVSSAPGLRRVIVSGYFGKRNHGDDVLLASLSEGLKRYSANPVELVVASEPPFELGAREGFDRNDLSLAEAQLRGASALVVGPGGLLHDLGFARSGGVAGMLTDARASVSGLARLPLLAHLLDRDVHLFGLGAGPLDDPGAQAATRLLADVSTSIVVRDDASRDILRSIPGWHAKVSTAPDLAFGWELPDGDAPAALRAVSAGWPVLAVNVRPSADAEALGLYERLAAAVSQVSRRYELAVTGFAMQGGARADHAALEHVFAALDTPHPTVVLDWEEDPATTVAVLRTSRAVVAMRLHACLLAHRLGRAAVGLAYDRKVSSHFTALGVGHLAFGLDASEEDLHEAIDAIAAPGQDLQPAFRAAVGAREDAAQAALSRLSARIDTAPPVPVPAAVAAAAAERAS